MMHPISISLKRSREKLAWPMMGREGHVEAPGRRRALLACLCAKGHHVTGVRPGTLGKGRRCPWLWQWEGERGGFLILPSSPPILTQAVLLAFLSGLLVYAFLGWSPLARRSEIQGGLAFGAQSWRCRPTHVPLETSRSWGLQVYLGPGAPLQEDGAPVSQVTHITSCHILHHLGVQPPPQRAPPVCIFLEGLRRECSFIQ